ncbi:MAG TPA: cytochrome c [Polyangiaceae bacterium]|jgi:mono/diheme cytochrome c family protein|nr:cytochrome c [Polyangiaceae bacterium]
MSLRLNFVAWGFGLMAAVAACGASQLGASDANFAKAKKMNAPGAEVFQRECAGCHGDKGEGLSGNPGLMGGGDLPLYKRDPATSTNPAFQQKSQYRTNQTTGDPRKAFKTAQDLYKYISTQMPLPESRMGSLKPEEYWAVINFILLGHGVSVPQGGVTEQNAASVDIQQHSD